MKKYLFLLFATILIVFSCKNEKNDNQLNISKDTTEKISPPNIVKFSNKTFGVPSPLMVSDLIKQKNIPFYSDKLNSVENKTKYLTSFKKALNLGIYGADLGYILLYDQLGTSGEYFATVKELAENLGIMNSLQEKTLERIQKNNENKDSLIAIISNVFRDIDEYLLDNKQQDIGIYIIVGGWIESIYLLTNVINDYNDNDLIQRLAEQKYPLNNILELIKPYYNKSPQTDTLIDKLVDISMIYDGIEEIYHYKNSKTIPKKKLTIVNSTTEYKITKQQISQIKNKIIALRNWVVN